MREGVKKIEGIMIREECGKADKYELTAILYNETDVDEQGKEFTVFITREDYEDNNPASISKNRH